MGFAVYVDTETTGFDAGTESVVEVAAVGDLDGDTVGFFSSLANPGRDAIERAASGKAFKVNMLSTEVLYQAPQLWRVAEGLRRTLVRWRDVWGPFEIHSFNVRFDRSFLSREPWDLSGDAWPWGECLMEASKRAMGLKRFPSLVEMASRMSLEWEGPPHRALSDARMAARLHRRILAHA